MHDIDLTLPWFTNYGQILGVFFFFCVLFHVLFVRLFPLSSIRWKQVDYAWLAMALVGLAASVSANRAMIAETLHSTAQARSGTALREVLDSLDFGTSGAICRTFVASEFSPPPDVMKRTQLEFDAQCRWFRKAREALNTHLKGGPESIQPARLFGAPPAGGEAWAYSRLAEAVTRYNDTLADLENLARAESASSLEAFLRFLGPLLIAVALALRITKVSGEIALERARL